MGIEEELKREGVTRKDKRGKEIIRTFPFKDQFLFDPEYNPETEKKIKEGGPKYRELVEKYGDPKEVIDTRKRESSNDMEFARECGYQLAYFGMELEKCFIIYSEYIFIRDGGRNLELFRNAMRKEYESTTDRFKVRRPNKHLLAKAADIEREYDLEDEDDLIFQMVMDYCINNMKDILDVIT